MARTDTLGHFLTDVADAIRTKSGSSGTIQASSFDTAISNIPSGGGSTVQEKDVNFYDYLGNLTNSYTKSEFLALNSMPNAPEHDGMTFQEWNWDLTDAKTYVTNYGMLDIGETCTTTDGKARIYIELPKDRTTPSLCFAINGTATVDWGDGSTEQTVSGSSTTTIIQTPHSYLNEGKYTITISSNDYVYFLGDTNGVSILYSVDIPNFYKRCVKKIELGNKFFLGNYAMTGSGIENINIPNTQTSLNYTHLFQSSKLKYITIPKEVTHLGSRTFNECRMLEKICLPHTSSSITMGTYLLYGTAINKITIPDTISSLGSYVFSNSIYLKQIILPSSITSVSASCFANCTALTYIGVKGHIGSWNSKQISQCTSIKTLDLRNNTSVAVKDSYFFGDGQPQDFKVVVPNDLYEDWITASGWSSSFVIKASDYEG